VCRRCYIHPALLEHYARGAWPIAEKPRAQRAGPEEVALLLFLQALRNRMTIKPVYSAHDAKKFPIGVKPLFLPPSTLADKPLTVCFSTCN
jgi:hypothetical protein